MGLISDLGVLALSTDGLEQAGELLQTVLEYAGTIAFAISGALVAARKRMDLVGVVVLGVIVAVGGGTTRDLLLGQVPVFWVDDPTFVVVAAVTSLVTIPLVNTGTMAAIQRFRVVAISDAAGMALFVVTGTTVALEVGADWIAAPIVGVIAGVGGGIIRDALAGEIPDVLKNGQFYASAALVGALLYEGMLQVGVNSLFAVWVAVACIFLIRAVSVWLGWGVPVFAVDDE